MGEMQSVELRHLLVLRKRRSFCNNTCDMDRKAIERLSGLGVIGTTSSGKEGVRVSLQDLRLVTEPSRRIRRDILRETFSRLNTEIDVDINLDSLSVSGQTVEAVLPADRYETIEQNLRGKKIRVELDLIRKAV